MNLNNNFILQCYTYCIYLNVYFKATSLILYGPCYGRLLLSAHQPVCKCLQLCVVYVYELCRCPDANYFQLTNSNWLCYFQQSLYLKQIYVMFKPCYLVFLCSLLI